MEIAEEFVFQTDSDEVLSFYAESPNYIVEYNNTCPKEYCIIYFSSHNIYNPNNKAEFERQLVRKDKFEWYGNRINNGHKHIFIRDIMKQWYLTGINSGINTPDKLFSLLKKETEGYKVITLGSSAGGFAAVMYGQRLKAQQIFSFNGQFEVFSLLKSSSSAVDPVLFRNRNNKELRSFYDSKNFITNPETINYFYSIRSQWDSEQKAYIEDLDINIVGFKTNHHGIPFLKSNLPVLLNSQKSILKSLKGKTYHPVIFSFKMVGFFTTIKSVAAASLIILARVKNKFFKK